MKRNMHIGLTALLCVATLVKSLPSSEAAVVCGDPGNSGTITVSDAVAMLRAAAGLPTLCSESICDLDLDGQITVTDAISALRVAAGLELPTQITCEQAEQQDLLDRSTLEVGVALIPARVTAGIAAATEAASMNCPEGGTAVIVGTQVTFTRCQDTGVVFNGAVTIVTQANVLHATFNLEATDLSTNEVLTTSGTVDLTVNSGTMNVTGITVNGTLFRSSSLLGDFSDTFDNLAATESVAGDITLVAGTLTTNVTNGLGRFVHLRSFTLTLADGQVVNSEFTFAPSS